jgi:hypothetical protein
VLLAPLPLLPQLLVPLAQTQQLQEQLELPLTLLLAPQAPTQQLVLGAVLALSQQG